MKLHHTIRAFCALMLIWFVVPTAASASGKYVDCVIVTDATLQPWAGALGPEYKITVENGCSGVQIGSVDIKFDSGSFDVFMSSSWSIWNLSSFGESKTFYLTNIKPGFYMPKVTITVNKDWSSKTVTLPSYQIMAPKQPDLGSNGGSVTLDPAPNVTSRQWCVSTPWTKNDCYTYPNWQMEMCSTSATAKLQQKISGTWTTLWTVKGKRNSACKSTYPYLYSLNVETKGKAVKNYFRLSFAKTSSQSAFVTSFSIAPR